MEKSLSRNDWKAIEKEIPGNVDISLDEPLVERDGKVLIKLKSKDANPGKYSKGEYYEVIAIEGNMTLIMRELKKETTFLMYGVEIRKTIHTLLILNPDSYHVPISNQGQNSCHDFKSCHV